MFVYLRSEMFRLISVLKDYEATYIWEDLQVTPLEIERNIWGK